MVDILIVGLIYFENFTLGKGHNIIIIIFILSIDPMYLNVTVLFISECLLATLFHTGKFISVINIKFFGLKYIRVQFFCITTTRPHTFICVLQELRNNSHP